VEQNLAARAEAEREAADEEVGRQGVRAFQRGDYREVIRLRRASAEQGNGNASLIVGTCYAELGDLAEAKKWFQKGAEQGQDQAQYLHAIALLNLGIERRDTLHFVEGRKWVQRSAQQGNQDAVKLSKELEKAANNPLEIASAIMRANETPAQQREREREREAEALKRQRQAQEREVAAIARQQRQRELEAIAGRALLEKAQRITERFTATNVRNLLGKPDRETDAFDGGKIYQYQQGDTTVYVHINRNRGVSGVRWNTRR
jgi:TPR repeat protein